MIFFTLIGRSSSLQREVLQANGSGVGDIQGSGACSILRYDKKLVARCELGGVHARALLLLLLPGSMSCWVGERVEDDEVIISRIRRELYLVAHHKRTRLPLEVGTFNACCIVCDFNAVKPIGIPFVSKKHNTHTQKERKGITNNRTLLFFRSETFCTPSSWRSGGK